MNLSKLLSRLSMLAFLALPVACGGVEGADENDDAITFQTADTNTAVAAPAYQLSTCRTDAPDATLLLNSSSNQGSETGQVTDYSGSCASHIADLKVSSSYIGLWSSGSFVISAAPSGGAATKAECEQLSMSFTVLKKRKTLATGNETDWTTVSSSGERAAIWVPTAPDFPEHCMYTTVNSNAVSNAALLWGDKPPMGYSDTYRVLVRTKKDGALVAPHVSYTGGY